MTTLHDLGVQGFVVQPPSVAYRLQQEQSSAVILHNSFNVFGAFGNFLNSNNHRFQQRFRYLQPPSIAASPAANATRANDDDDNTPAGTYRLLSLPVRSIKPGGLRLFLLLYLLGQQQYNTATETAVWKADESGRASIDFSYLPDRSALLSITLTRSHITIDRVGSDPSTAYVIQEAAIVEGLLRELEHCAIGDRGNIIPETDRLVTFPDTALLATVRAELAFG